MSFHHPILRYFSPESLDRHSRFLRKIVRLLVLEGRSDTSPDGR